jgi:hypothetical protein
MNFVDELLDKTKIHTTGTKCTVKCPICETLKEFSTKTIANDSLTIIWSLGNHLYYCLAPIVPNPNLRNNIAHTWSISVRKRILQKLRGDANGSS